MTNEFLTRQSALVLSAYAGGMGVPADAFSTGLLTVAERPAHAPWPYIALAISCPGGTVLSIAPEMVEFARAKAPGSPVQAAKPQFLWRLATEAERLGRRASLDGPNICWALGREPAEPVLGDGLRVELKDAAWMNALIAAGEFENGVGAPGVNARTVRNRYAVAVVDDGGAPVAVAGAFDSFGLMEVGVDVVPGRQGEGLGTAAVAALTREILARGETPFYGCATTNIRSQRTAASAGYVPVFADATIDG